MSAGHLQAARLIVGTLSHRLSKSRLIPLIRAHDLPPRNSLLPQLLFGVFMHIPENNLLRVQEIVKTHRPIRLKVRLTQGRTLILHGGELLIAERAGLHELLFVALFLELD